MVPVEDSRPSKKSVFPSSTRAGVALLWPGYSSERGSGKWGRPASAGSIRNPIATAASPPIRRAPAPDLRPRGGICSSVCSERQRQDRLDPLRPGQGALGDETDAALEEADELQHRRLVRNAGRRLLRVRVLPLDPVALQLVGGEAEDLSQERSALGAFAVA